MDLNRIVQEVTKIRDSANQILEGLQKGITLNVAVGQYTEKSEPINLYDAVLTVVNEGTTMHGSISPNEIFTALTNLGFKVSKHQVNYTISKLSKGKLIKSVSHGKWASK